MLEQILNVKSGGKTIKDIIDNKIRVSGVIGNYIVRNAQIHMIIQVNTTYYLGYNFYENIGGRRDMDEATAAFNFVILYGERPANTRIYFSEATVRDQGLLKLNNIKLHQTKEGEMSMF